MLSFGRPRGRYCRGMIYLRACQTLWPLRHKLRSPLSDLSGPGGHFLSPCQRSKMTFSRNCERIILITRWERFVVFSPTQHGQVRSGRVYVKKQNETVLLGIELRQRQKTTCDQAINDNAMETRGAFESHWSRWAFIVGNSGGFLQSYVWPREVHT
jgi:hypothetical protein